ncbi:hypothetical protein J6590_022335 [Homalodisca vitripennis]|nr:hypothetical protein J6590_022335 [Homalodisca vitripennis]
MVSNDTVGPERCRSASVSDPSLHHVSDKLFWRQLHNYNELPSRRRRLWHCDAWCSFPGGGTRGSECALEYNYNIYIQYQNVNTIRPDAPNNGAISLRDTIASKARSLEEGLGAYQNVKTIRPDAPNNGAISLRDTIASKARSLEEGLGAVSVR